MPTRRQVVAYGTVAGTAALVPAALWTRAAASVPGGTLDPKTVPKYVTPLFVMPAMPTSGAGSGLDSYQVATRQTRQQILPAGLPRTDVFAYGAVGRSETF